MKTFIVIITVIPWSVIIVLLVQIKKLVTNITVESIPIIEMPDTTINVQPKFFSQTPEEGLEEALSYYNLKHKDIVYAQAVLETGHFKSDICLKNNNLFGLYNSDKKQYYKFKHWAESLVAYKEIIQSKYHHGDYYAFLEKLNYAEDKNYTKIVKDIVNKNKYD